MRDKKIERDKSCDVGRYTAQLSTAKNNAPGTRNMHTDHTTTSTVECTVFVKQQHKTLRRLLLLSMKLMMADLPLADMTRQCIV